MVQSFRELWGGETQQRKPLKYTREQQAETK